MSPDSLNDLWRLDPGTGDWTWVKGVPATEVPGNHGMPLIPGSSHFPGGRTGAACWRDGTGSLWLFGGDGLDASGNVGELNDLWRILEFSEVTFATDGTPGASISGISQQSVIHIDDCSPVMAVAPPGSHFLKWTEGGLDYSPENPLTVRNVSRDIDLTAVFATNEYRLRYSAGPGGSVTGTTPQTVTHGSDGTPIQAVPDAGFHFLQWSDGSPANPRTDRNVSSDVNVTAYFALSEYELLYTASGNGSVAGPVHQRVSHGFGGVSVEAMPDEGSHFAQWNDDSTDNPRTDSGITSDLVLIAFFELNEYTLNYSAGENGSITGISPQTVRHGYNGTEVRAVPAGGYYFTEWSDGSRNNPRVDLNVTGNLDVTAHFETIANSQHWVVR